eukprot:6468720-Alexandrium_andersonii.AAC.1
MSCGTSRLGATSAEHRRQGGRVHHLPPQGTDEDGGIMHHTAAGSWLFAGPLDFLLACRAGSSATCSAARSAP